MTNLTEQWKKGELPSGEYYIIDDLGLNATDRYYPSHGFGAELPQAVLAPVPSYEEWKEYKEANDSMFDTIKMLNKDNYKLEDKNTKLKELLKECRENIASIDYDSSVLDREQSILLNKIDQVLGEE